MKEREIPFWFVRLLEQTVGSLVLELPIRDLKKVNKMLVRNMERKKNAEVQEEDNAPDGL